MQDDGSIDSDFEEVLKSTQFIKNFGSCFFIRCGAASVNLCSRAADSHSPPALCVHRNEGGGSGGGEGIGKVTRVHLPNHEYQVREGGAQLFERNVGLIAFSLGQWQTVKITPGMQAKELLSKVCKRAGAIEMSDHYLHLKSTDSEVPWLLIIVLLLLCI